MEAALDWERRASDRALYREWLARLYGFHRTWEPAIATALAAPAFFEPRRKLHLLADDLARLEVDGEALERLPGPAEPFIFGSEAEALGSLYVLEGSSLGGTLIARHVVARIGHVPRYHDAYGPQTGAMWRAFQERLQTRVDPASAEVAVAAANATFTQLRQWLVGADDAGMTAADRHAIVAR